MTGSLSNSTPLRFVDHADMRRDDAPALRKPHPCLHLPADLARSVPAAEQCRGDPEIAAISRDLRALQRAREARRRPRGAKRADFLDPIEVLGRAVADAFARIDEEAVERRYVVADQRALVSCEHRLEFGVGFRIIDDHENPSWLRSRGPTPPREERGGEKRRGSRDLSDRRAHGPLALQRA